MNSVKIKIISTKPSLRINTDWFSFMEIVDQKEFEKVCSSIESYISKYGLKKVKVYIHVLEFDSHNNPLKIVIECNTKTGFLKEINGSYTLFTKVNQN